MIASSTHFSFVDVAKLQTQKSERKLSLMKILSLTEQPINRHKNKKRDN